MDNQQLLKTEKWLDDFKNNKPQQAPLNELVEPTQAGVYQNSKIK
jgi:hypothetical protein